jgi:nucleoside-triphosphatase THEP1
MAGWSAIVGPVGSNKTGHALHVARALRARGLRVGGFVQHELRGPDGAIEGWDLEHVAGGDRLPLARRSPTPAICGWGFDDEAFAAAARWLRDRGADVVVAGGVGKLEAAGRGHWPALHEVASLGVGPHAVLCVRADCLSTIALGLPDPLAFVELPARATEVQRLVDAIALACEPDSAATAPSLA